MKIIENLHYVNYHEFYLKFKFIFLSKLNGFLNIKISKKKIKLQTICAIFILKIISIYVKKKK